MDFIYVCVSTRVTRKKFKLNLSRAESPRT